MNTHSTNDVNAPIQYHAFRRNTPSYMYTTSMNDVTVKATTKDVKAHQLFLKERT